MRPKQHAYDYAAIRMLAEVGRCGSMTEGAAALGITQPAISQRITKLEEQFNQPLISRTRPCRLTETGLLLTGLLDRVSTLERDAEKVLSDLTQKTVIKASINADSLATWFPAVMVEAVKRLEVTFDILSEDQERSALLLESHIVSAIVTARAGAVPGCQVHPLGEMIYCTVATKEFVQRHSLGGDQSLGDLHAAPILFFDHDDTLPVQWLRKALCNDALDDRNLGERHYFPSYEGYNRACLSGLGIGNMPLFHAAPYLENGALVEIRKEVRLPVSLYWQIVRRPGPTMANLTRIISRVASQSMNGVPNR